MRGHLLKYTAQAVRRMPKRYCTTVAAKSDQEVVVLTQEQKDLLYPKLGNRDMVGHGITGLPSYEDRPDYPFPSVRFGANTSEVLALRQKEKGDWNDLTMQERKGLYRASYRQTFAEMNAPTGNWKSILGATAMFLSVMAVFTLWQEEFIFKKALPYSMSSEYKEYTVARQVKQGQGAMYGVSSEYDFDKKEWKK